MDSGPLIHDLMPIGRFAQAARLSPKALRLYGDLGLLTPTHIDPDSGYRYYAEAQLGQAKLISLLRQLEMPLERIARVVNLSGPHAALEVEAYWRGVEHDRSAKARLAAYLEAHLGGKGKQMFDIQTRAVPEQKVLSVQRNVYVKDLSAFIGEAHDTLYGHLAGAGLETTGPSFVIYHREVNEDSDGPVEVCAPFAGPLEPAGRMHVRLEPAHHEAFTRLSRAQMAFPGLLEAYSALHEWLRAEGKEPADAPREVYFADWNSVEADDPACDIAWPFR